MSDELRKEFASGILISDVLSYVDAHNHDYEHWLKTKAQTSKKEFSLKSRSNKDSTTISE